MPRDRLGMKVAAFTVVMLLVLGLLVVTFGKFRLGSTVSYRAEFDSVSRLKPGQDVRVAGIPVGSVTDIAINGDHVDVEFAIDKTYRIYSSTRAAIRYEDLVGNRYLEISTGSGELRPLAPGGTIPRSNTVPAVDLDALLGGLRPVLKGLDASKVNEVSNAIIELLQGNGGTLAKVLSDTDSFTRTLAGRDQLIGEVIDNLNTVLTSIDDKGAQLDTSIDHLQQLTTTLSEGRGPIAGAIQPLASAQADLTDLLTSSRRPLQGVIENARPLATVLDDRKDEVNAVIEPLAENYLRLSALGQYGAFFNIFFCAVKIKINGPAGSDILIPLLGPTDSSKGRCSDDG
ncbi:MCE family protein [Mycolicibacterium novocastrense]|uniref:MCE family protein n=1 Tax=Mycolicibacterium novocastrense TaxID=59813 RepID=A0AAW5SQ70_MYCNV|nr:MULTISPECIES: MCE family protein [Mycolicibacterium]MCV7026243.1 MCE family protein [Mycolicibacterium novocastrense]GAT07521.1 MCE-family protein mce4B [Mycolicibacterium novocastrense]CRL77888.1 MCE-family protein Mce4B [Mycolicibacterium malmesburyense]